MCTWRVARSSASGAVSGASVSKSCRLRLPGSAKMSRGWKSVNGSFLGGLTASSTLLVRGRGRGSRARLRQELGGGRARVRARVRVVGRGSG